MTQNKPKMAPRRQKYLFLAIFGPKLLFLAYHWPKRSLYTATFHFQLETAVFWPETALFALPGWKVYGVPSPMLVYFTVRGYPQPQPSWFDLCPLVMYGHHSIPIRQWKGLDLNDLRDWLKLQTFCCSTHGKVLTASHPTFLFQNLHPVMARTPSPKKKCPRVGLNGLFKLKKYFFCTSLLTFI